MKYSILYMIFEGLSKGGNHVLLLFIASIIDPSIYLTIMLLISFETLLPIFVISSYNEVLYSIKDKFEKKNIFSTVMTVTTVMSVFYLISVIILKTYLYEYFSYDNLFVYIAIAVNIFFFVYFRFISIFYQLEENHSWAIYLKSLPFFLSFVGVLFGVLLFEDKVFGFFMGKLAGYCVAFLIFTMRNQIFSLNFHIDIKFLEQYIKRTKFLVLLGVFGWLSGYGFLNIIKYFGTEEETIMLGYMLNFYMVLLLIGNGINQVYNSRLRVIFKNDIHESIKFSIKTILIYWFISFIIFLLTLIFMQYFLTYSYSIALAQILFFILSFYYVSNVYIYLFDKYKVYTYLSISVDAIIFVGIFLSNLYFDINIYIFYMLLMLSRALLSSVITIIFIKKRRDFEKKRLFS
jgi:O-antigen/teichoic acid export membrane protein